MKKVLHKDNLYGILIIEEKENMKEGITNG